MLERTRRLTLPFVTLGVVLAPSGTAAQGTPRPELVDRVAAVVGDSTVLLSQVLEDMERLLAADPSLPRQGSPEYPEFFREILGTWVDRMLVIQAAARDSLIQPDEASIDRQIAERLDALTNQFGTQAALQQALAREGWTLAEYRENLRQDARQVQIFQMFFQLRLRDARPVEISEQELQQRFQEASAQLQQRPRTLTFRQVVLRPEASDSAKARARAEAEALLDRALAGEDFAALATEHSDDVGTAALGGDLGWFRRGQMVPEFENAAFSLAPGRISTVVESVFGYHVIKVERVRGRSEVQARHILIVPESDPADLDAARRLGTEIAERARAGESMQELFDEYSDPLLPDSLTIAFDQLDDFPAAYSALRLASTGDVMGPLEYQPAGSRQGDLRFAVVKVLQVREAGAYTFEDLRPQIASQLQQERQRQALLDELRSKTFVDIRM